MSLGPVIESVVDDKVQAGEMFTAHNVTLEVRNRGHYASHGEVRDGVHDYYNRGGLGVDYTRTVISVPNGQPWLYHRIIDDPQTYGNIYNSTNSTSQTQTSNVAANVATNSAQPVVSIPSNLLNNLNGHTNAQNKAGSTKDRVVDGRETLSIPVSVVKGVGFRAGQTVSVSTATFKDPVGVDEIVLDIYDTLSPAGGRAKTLGSYTVDSHNQIRITQGLLKKAGLGGNKYDIEEVSGSIRVKLAK